MYALTLYKQLFSDLLHRQLWLDISNTLLESLTQTTLSLYK